MKLTTLKSALQVARGQLQGLPATSTGTVQRKRGTTGVKDRNKIRLRDLGMCQQCKAEGRSILGDVVDHRIPLWEGGSDEDSNKWLLCHAHHDAKTAIEAGRRAGR